MHVLVERWGDGLAIRIPAPVADAAGLAAGTVVDLSVDAGRVVLAPAPEARVSLDRLIGGITPENLHGEVDPGPAVGREAW